MKFIDLDAQQKKIRARIEDRILKVLDHGNYIMGPEVFELEKNLLNTLVLIIVFPALQVQMP